MEATGNFEPELILFKYTPDLRLSDAGLRLVRVDG
jgi:hypothetical protein